MLPDFPELKTKLDRYLTARMKRVHAKHSSPIGDIPFAHIQEGHKVMMVREDGSEEEIPMKHHSVTIRLTTEELETLSTEDIYRKFDEAARNMAMQTGSTFIESLDKSVREVGNVVEYKGKITADDLLKMHETILIDFDEDGRPQLPTLICGNKLYNELTELVPEFESDPDLMLRFANVIARKKEEWRDREASRKLVG